MTDLMGTFLLGPDSGRVLIKTGRTGLAAKVGHDLTIEITRWSARVTIPDAGVNSAQITAELDLGSLAVREGTGGAKPLSDKDRGEIVKTAGKILGTGAASFASARFVPAASGSGGAIEGTLTLNGRSQPVTLEAAGAPDGRYRGTATVRQTDFGITPYSGFFGALKLRDEIGIELEADLDRAGRG